MSVRDYLRADIEALFGDGLELRYAVQLLGSAAFDQARRAGVLAVEPRLHGVAGFNVRRRGGCVSCFVDIVEQHRATAGPGAAEAIGAYAAELMLRDEDSDLSGPALDAAAEVYGVYRRDGELDEALRRRCLAAYLRRPGLR